jgi:integrase
MQTKKITPHTLRHTAAMNLQMSRVASDASFRRIREPVWPAVLFTAGQAAAGRAMW